MSYFRSYPVLRSMSVYACLYPAANIVQQSIVISNHRGQDQKLDWQQAGRFCIYGSMCHAPLVYNAINFVGRRFPGIAISQLIKKVLTDQLVFAPFALSSFYIGLAVLERKNANEIWTEWKEKFPRTWKASAFVWPFIQLFNYRFVPGVYRAVFVGVMSFFWTILLSFWKNTD